MKSTFVSTSSVEGLSFPPHCMWKRWRPCLMAEWRQGIKHLESRGWPVRLPVRLPGMMTVVLTLGCHPLHPTWELASQIPTTSLTQSLSTNLTQSLTQPQTQPQPQPHKSHKPHKPENELPPIQCHNPIKPRENGVVEWHKSSSRQSLA